MTTFAWYILWIPFAAAAIIAFFLKSRPKIAGLLATTAMFACFALSLKLLLDFSNVGFERTPFEAAITWMPVQNFSIEFGVLVNKMSVLMLLIVTGVGSLIFLFSTSYMAKDPGYSRYFACLSFFAFSMLGIVLSNNLIQIFIFWELVGLASYLLVGFWFEKDSAATAGKKAFLTTRVGDVGMMIGILMLFGFMSQAGYATFNFLVLEHNLAAAAIPAGFMTAIALLIFMGVMGKSAQVPLHVWLPDAMEGPTPVSALIHAATMVAAGVFLLARLFFLFAASADAMQIIAWTGGITALLAGTIAIVQNDIKKILAYSTLSQLGYMVMALGLGNPEAGMFHLTTHAFFKALLFLGAASFIHAMHTQDIWQMESGLFKKMPVTTLTFFIGTLALMGIPPLSGYFSKEEILNTAFHHSPALFGIAAATVFFTSFYMGRLSTVVFFRKKDGQGHAHEAGFAVSLPLIILGIFSAIAGFLPFDVLLPADIEKHHEGNLVQIISLTSAAAGFFLAFFSFRNKKQAAAGAKILERKYFFDDFYDGVVIKGIQENIAKVSNAFENFILVKGAADGSAKLAQGLGNFLRKAQTGVVQLYALVFVIGLIVILYSVMVWGKS